MPYRLCLLFIYDKHLIDDVIPQWVPHRPSTCLFVLEAVILSRMRSPVTSRSNWANDSSTFKVSRPMELDVLNCWVTETKETWCSSKSSIRTDKVCKRAGKPVHLVYHNHIYGLDILQQLCQSRTFCIPTGEPTVVILFGYGFPAFVLLTLDIRFTGLPLCI